MRILKITNADGLAVLTTRSVEVVDFSNLPAVLEQMKQLMGENPLAGLSANQVGMLERFFVVDMNTGTKEDADIRMFVNPVIKPDKQAGESWAFEGCGSIPNLEFMVKRWNKITVTAKDENGVDVSLTVKGFLARVFLHEQDHISGIMLYDKKWRQRRNIS